MSSEEGDALNVLGVDMRFGGNQALAAVDLRLAQGEWLGLVGPNGSGKTTLLNVISGFYQPQAGTTLVGGLALGVSPKARSLAGIARTFQHPQLAESLTLRENMELGNDLASRRGTASTSTTASGLKIMEIFGYNKYLDALPARVPYGAQKAVEIARAFVARPTVLLLDEPAAGLSAEERGELVSAFTQIKREDPQLSVCLVEHDIRLVASVCPTLQVLDFGRVIANGASSEVLSHPDVQTAYLGSKGLKERGH